VADFSLLTKEQPFKSLLVPLKRKGGRNNRGRVTVRHQGGGHKRHYRLIEFGQKHLGQHGRVEALEYDPNRTAFIARIVWQDGSRSYILAPQGLEQGHQVQYGETAPLNSGNRAMLQNISVGTKVYNVELKPGGGGKLARSAGSWVEVMAHEGDYTNLKMPSGEIRRVLSRGFASIGQLSNPEWTLLSLGKAGRSRWMGIRPTVRGSAMNPRDHPYGGGEGRAVRGTRRPKTKWGKITGGKKTRKKKKWSNVFIMQRRPKKK